MRRAIDDGWFFFLTLIILRTTLRLRGVRSLRDHAYSTAAGDLLLYRWLPEPGGFSWLIHTVG